MKIINQKSFDQIIPILSSKYPEFEDYFNTKLKKYLIKEYCEKVGFICDQGLFHICSENHQINNPRFYADYWNSCPLLSNTFKAQSMTFDSFIYDKIHIKDTDPMFEPLYLFDIEKFNHFINQKFVSVIWFLAQYPKYKKIGTINLINDELFKSFATHMLQFNCKTMGLNSAEILAIIKKFDISTVNVVELKTKNEFNAAGAIMANCLGNHVRSNTFLFKHKIIQNKFYGIAAFKYRKFLFFDYIIEISGYNNHEIKTKNAFYNIFTKLNNKNKFYFIFSLFMTFTIDSFFYLGISGLAYSMTTKSFSSMFTNAFFYGIIVFLLPSINTSIDRLIQVLIAAKDVVFKK